MKKALVFFFAIVIGLSFTFTGFAQQTTTSGPAKPPKDLPKGKYTQKKKAPQASGAQAQTTTPAKPAASTTPAKPAASTSSGAPVHEQNGVIGPGSAAGKKLSKGRYTKEKTNKPQ